MKKLKNIKTFINHQPNEVIGYYGRGPNSYLFFAIPLLWLTGFAWQLVSYGALPLAAWTLYTWYRVFRPDIYFVINDNGITIQSPYGFHKWCYNWSAIAAFNFKEKPAYSRRRDEVVRKLVFQKKEGGRNLVINLYGMDKVFNELVRKVEGLAAANHIPHAVL